MNILCCEINIIYIQLAQMSEGPGFIPKLLAFAAILAIIFFLTFSSKYFNQKSKVLKAGIIDMIKNGNIAGIQKMVSDNTELDFYDGSGIAPIHYAVFKGNPNIVKVLLEHKPNLEFPCNNIIVIKKEIFYDLIFIVYEQDFSGKKYFTDILKNFTALMIAACLKNSEVLSSLIFKGANLNCADSLGMTPLFYAICSDSPENIRLLIEKGANVNVISKPPAGKHPLNNYVKYNITPLMCAVVKSSVEIVSLLLEKISDINVKNSAMETALNFAVRRKNKEIGGLLIARGAKMDLKEQTKAGDDYAITMLEFYLRGTPENKMELETYFKMAQVAKYQDGNSPLLQACYRDYDKTVGYMLENGMKIGDKNDKLEQLPITMAVSCGNFDTLKFLIEKGALEKITENMIAEIISIAFSVAIETGRKEALKYLIEKKPMLSISNPKWFELWKNLLNKKKLDFEILNLMLKKCDNINMKNRAGETPLFIAAYCGNVDAIKTLIECGADVNEKNYEGKTGLMLAISYYKIDAAKYLIANGADLNIRDNNEQTALAIAVSKKLGEITDLLKRNGATD